MPDCCGLGNNARSCGQSSVRPQLKRLEIPFVLIETNDGLYRELLKDGVFVIQGDAKRHDIWSQGNLLKLGYPWIPTDRSVWVTQYTNASTLGPAPHATRPNTPKTQTAGVSPAV